MSKGTALSNEWADFISQGDEQAFFALYTHYYHYLSYLGFQKSFPAAKVKDTVNDVFLYLWEHRGEMEHISHFHNYIVTTFLRGLYKKEKFSLEDINDHEEFMVSPSLEELHINRHSASNANTILKEYVDKLPAKQRLLIYQKFYLGLSYQEIADNNHISINTVYNTIYKAVDKLKTLIGKEQLAVLSLAITLATILIAHLLIT